MLSLTASGTFVVRGAAGGLAGTYYAAGLTVHPDDDDCLVSSDGLRLQGYASADAPVGSPLVDLCTPQPNPLPSTATKTVKVSLALNAGAAVSRAFDASQPASTSRAPVSFNIVDDTGHVRSVSLFMLKTDVAAWEWHAMAHRGSLTAGALGPLFEGANGKVTFDANGAVASQTTLSSLWTFVGSAAGQSIAFDFGASTVDSFAEVATDDGGVTQAPSDNGAASVGQDGFLGGLRQGFMIGADGSVVAAFSNGQRRLLGQLALAGFVNEAGLVPVTSELSQRSTASGEPMLARASSAVGGSVVATLVTAKKP